MASPSSETLASGEYHPAAPGDLRSPCPILNSLANHGYLSRDGRNITPDQLTEALKHISIGIDIRHFFITGVFNVHGANSGVGLRDPGQVNESGTPVINLDQIGRTDAVEHDVSLTREDRALGDCMSSDPELVDKLILYPGKQASFSVPDLGRFRKLRLEEQAAKNPKLKFGSEEHKVGCFEAGLLQATFSTGIFYALPVQYAKALFREERLPYREGWRPRWTPLMFPEQLIVQSVTSYYAS